MKLNKLILVLIFLILISSVDGFFIGDVNCNKDGSINLIFSSEINDKIYTKDIKIKATYLTWYDSPISSFDVNGTWDRNKINGYEMSDFKSDEAIFNSPGKYLIEASYNDKITNYNLENCVGLIFSCKIIGMEIKNCSTVDNEYFSSLLKITGLDQLNKLDLLEDISYKLTAEKRYEDYRGKFSDVGSWPKGFKINKVDNDEYFFSYEFKNNFIKNIEMEFKELSKCKKYGVKLYDKKECNIVMTEDNNTSQELLKEEFGDEITGGVVRDIPQKVIFTKEKSSKWIYLLLGGFFVVFITVMIIVLKNKKVNKWV